VQGVISGDAVLGTITDGDGNLIARFSGTVSKTGIQGTYADRTGEVGEWSWDGAVPQ
jgi:hypothetical protein